MNVLTISSYGVLGGAELSTVTFLEHRPPRVHASALLISDGPLRDELCRVGVAATAARGLEGRPNALKLGRATRLLSARLRAERPDLVWAIGQKATLLAVPACRLARVPLIWHKVDFSWDSLLSLPLALGARGIIGASEALLAPLGPFPRSRVLGTVPWPVRLPGSLRSAADPQHPIIGTLGRLVPYKGHHHIVRAAALLVNRFPTLRLVLAGAAVREYPDYPSHLRALSRQLDLDERVELPGFSDPAALLPGLSVYVNATYRDEEGFGLEGLGGAMLEASWVGVPVVAVRGGGAAEAVIDGHTGVLVDQADPAALAQAIGSYLDDPGRAARDGAAGREFARARSAPGPAAERLFALLQSAVA